MDGRVEWPEGTLFVPEKLRSAFAQLTPGDTVAIVGDFERAEGRTPVLKVTAPPEPVANARTKALAAVNDPVALERWLKFIFELNPVTEALRAVLAAHQGKTAKAQELLRSALSTPLPPLRPTAIEPIALAWSLLTDQGAQPVLDRAQTDVFLAYAWRAVGLGHADYAIRMQKQLVEPSVRDAYFALRTNYVAPPWHFGGMRVDASPEALGPWVVGEFCRLAPPAEREEVEKVRGLDQGELRAYVTEMEEHDDGLAVTQNPVDARGMLWRHTAQGGLAHLRSSLLEGALPAWRVVHATREREGDDAARWFAFTYDAAVLLAGLAPELWARFSKLVYCHAALRGGCALLALQGGEELVLLHSPHGALDDWQVHNGSASEVLACVPDTHFAEAVKAVKALGA